MIMAVRRIITRILRRKRNPVQIKMQSNDRDIVVADLHRVSFLPPNNIEIAGIPYWQSFKNFCDAAENETTNNYVIEWPRSTRKAVISASIASVDTSAEVGCAVTFSAKLTASKITFI